MFRREVEVERDPARSQSASAEPTTRSDFRTGTMTTTSVAVPNRSAPLPVDGAGSKCWALERKSGHGRGVKRAVEEVAR